MHKPQIHTYYVIRISRNLFKYITLQNYTDPAFQPLRKTFTKGLRAYGEGGTRLENIIQDTTLDVIEGLKERQGQTFDPYDVIFSYVCCIASTIVSIYFVFLTCFMISDLSI